MRTKNIRKNAFSLVELLIAISIFSIISVALISGISYLQTSSIATRDQSNAIFIIKETFSIIKSLRNNGWNEIEKDVALGLKLESGVWEVDSQQGYDEIGKFRREVVFRSVCRDNNDNIVECPGAYTDVWSLKADIRISWFNEINVPKEIVRSYILSNWNSNSWINDNYSSFGNGQQSDVVLSTEYGDGDGSVILEPSSSSVNWGCFSPTYQTIDLTGTDSVNKLISLGAYIISGTNSSIYVINKDTFSTVGQLDIGGKVNDMIYRDGLLYVGTNNSQRELSVIDLSQVNNPVLVGSHDLPGSTNITSILTKDDYLFTFTENNPVANEIFVFNIADLGVTISGFELGESVKTSQIYGNYIVISQENNNQEISIIDISNVTNISQTNVIDVPGNNIVINVTIRGSIGYFTDNVSSKTYLYDMLDMNNPLLLNEITLSTLGITNPLSVFTQGVYFFFGGVQKVSVVKIIDGESFRLISDFKLVGSVHSMVTSSSGVYVGSNNSTGEIVALESLNQMSWICANEVGNITTNTSTPIKNINVVERNGIEYVFFTQDSRGLFVYEKSNGIYILKNSVSILNTVLSDLKISGDYAYIATSNNNEELMILDISDLSNIIKVGSFNSFGNIDATSVFVTGDTAYLGTRRNNSGKTRAEVYVINLTNKNAPVLQTSNSYYRLNQDVTDIVVKDNYVYVGNNANRKQISVLNVTDPSNIVLLQNVGTPKNNEVMKLELIGNNLYATNGIGKSFVNYSIDANYTLSQLGIIELSFEIIDFSVGGDNVFIITTDTNGQLKVINNTDKSNPVELVSHSLKTSPSATFFYSNKLYYSHLGSGVGGNLAGITIWTQVELESGLSEGYKESGYYISSAYDIGTGELVEIVSWDEDLSLCQGDCTVNFQVRVSSDNVTWTDWFGASGVGSYFTNQVGEIIPKEYNGYRWIQYKIILSGSGLGTPIVNRVNVQYK